MINKIIRLLEENSNAEQAEKMSAYMKNQFIFAGIPKPELKKLIKPFLKDTAKEKTDWELIFKLWTVDYREAQYIALEYLGKHHKTLCPSDLDKLKYLIVHKSWWETVDTIDAFVGEIVLQDEMLKNTMLEWAKDSNLWLRRVAIDFQQAYKNQTDCDLLEEIIVLNFGSNAFFINKAIGWSLREYGKIDPEWVEDFVERHRHEMASLSIKEATKLLGKK